MGGACVVPPGIEKLPPDRNSLGRDSLGRVVVAGAVGVVASGGLEYPPDEPDEPDEPDADEPDDDREDEEPDELPPLCAKTGLVVKTPKRARTTTLRIPHSSKFRLKIFCFRRT